MSEGIRGVEHPSVDRLRTFGSGQLNEAEASLVEEHVSHCEACARTLANVGSDTFTSLLRVAGRANAADDATVPPRPRPANDEAVGATECERTSAEVGAGADLLCLPPELREHPRYRVLALLGSGGMGAVFKAEHRLMERLVALKVMARSLLGSPALVERFRREVRAAARLAHPNIVTAHDAEQAGDLHFLVMEHVEGIDLDRLVKEQGPLPIGAACDYVRQAAAGLQHAHEHGMIHRDIKPHNLMLTPQDVVKILDFGLARLASEAGSQAHSPTAQGTVLGTVDYMAPEQADDAHQADIRSDIYSLGCTLYHLLCGRPPFPKGTLVQKILAHTERQPQPLRELRPEIPPALARIAGRMMAKRPDDRYQTPAEVCIALEPFAEAAVSLAPGQPVPQKSTRLPRKSTAERAEPVTVRKRRQPRTQAGAAVRPLRSRPRQRWPIAVGLLLFLLGLLGAAVAVYHVKTDNGELVISTENPDVEVIIKQNGKIVRIIDTKTGKEIKLHSGFYELELGEKAKGQGLKLSLDKVTIQRGDTVVARIERRPIGTEKEVAARPELLHAIPWQDESQGFPSNIWVTGISADGRYFFGAGDAGLTGSVRVFEVATGKQVQELVIGEDTPGQIPYAFAQLVPGSKQILISYHFKKEIFLWDFATGKLVRKFEGHSQPETRFAVSPDGKRLLSWSDDSTLRLWDMATGKELHKLEGHTDKAAGVFSPDGKQILSFSPDKTLRLWDAATGKELKKLEGHTDACTGCFAPDGKQALSYSPDQTIRLWDLGSGKEVRSFEGPTSKVEHAYFVAGGRRVVGRTEDKKLRIWEKDNGKLVGEIDGSTYGGDGWTLMCTPDGKQALVSVEGDGSVRVLALPSGKETHRFDKCPKARAWSFSPDGSVVVAGSFRAGMYVFRLPSPAASGKEGEKK